MRTATSRNVVLCLIVGCLPLCVSASVGTTERRPRKKMHHQYRCTEAAANRRMNPRYQRLQPGRQPSKTCIVRRKIRSDGTEDSPAARQIARLARNAENFTAGSLHYTSRPRVVNLRPITPRYTTLRKQSTYFHAVDLKLGSRHNNGIRIRLVLSTGFQSGVGPSGPRHHSKGVARTQPRGHSLCSFSFSSLVVP